MPMVGTISPGFCQTLADASAAFPLFGGTAPDASAVSPASVASEGTSDALAGTSDAPAGTPPAETPTGGELGPEQIAELLKQVSDLTSKVGNLTQENNTYKAKEQQAVRAQQTREQQLETDLNESQKIIAQMDAVIKHSAIINAIQGAKDFEFHSARQVMNELDMESFELDVDLESGTATVTGIETDLKRIAKEMPWLVSKDKAAAPDATRQPRSSRGSGVPPAPANASGDKASKRAALIGKYPVIAHGRG